MIVLCGKRNSGKNYIAELLRQELGPDIPISIRAFADPIKNIVNKYFNVPVINLWGPSPLRDKIPDKWKNIDEELNGAKWKLETSPNTKEIRVLRECFEHIYHFYKETPPYQTNPTPRELLKHIGQRFRQEFGPDYWFNKVAEPVEKGLVIITDGRFENEILPIKKGGGLIIKIIRPNNLFLDSHITETSLDSIQESLFDKIFVNLPTTDDNFDSNFNNLSALIRDYANKFK